MLKTILPILILSLALLVSAPALAKRDAPAAGYQPDTVYSGIYKQGLLYQYSPWKKLWYVSKEHRRWEVLNCREAVRELSIRGTWRGNLGHAGECLGKEEAPTWATGNYLNYQINR